MRREEWHLLTHPINLINDQVIREILILAYNSASEAVLVLSSGLQEKAFFTTARKHSLRGSHPPLVSQQDDNHGLAAEKFWLSLGVQSQTLKFQLLSNFLPSPSLSLLTPALVQVKTQAKFGKEIRWIIPYTQFPVPKHSTLFPPSFSLGRFSICSQVSSLRLSYLYLCKALAGKHVSPILYHILDKLPSRRWAQNWGIILLFKHTGLVTYSDAVPRKEWDKSLQQNFLWKALEGENPFSPYSTSKQN